MSEDLELKESSEQFGQINDSLQSANEDFAELASSFRQLAGSYTELVEQYRCEVVPIIELVQGNPEIFGATVGQSCLRAAHARLLDWANEYERQRVMEEVKNVKT